MSNLMSLIRRAPKRTSAIVAMIAAAIIVPAVVFAWGPSRPTYTYDSPAPHVTFNSITDNPSVGDERNFIRIREDATGTSFSDNVTFEPGKVYEVMAYYHNNAKTSLNASGVGIAQNAKLRMEVPGVVKGGVNAALTGFISADNATPGTVWDEAYGKNATNADIAVRYVSNSAKVTSNGAVNGQTVPDSLFTTGAFLGYEAQDGKLKGCNEFAGYVIFKLRVDQPNFTVKKEVSTDGKTWVDDTVKAAAGSTVQYRITYQNTGTNQQDNVNLRDTLPTGVSYVPGSSLIANATTGGVYKPTIDGITTTGIVAGSYAPQGNVYYKFSAKLPSEDQLKCGTNTLVNNARALTSGGSKDDTATVTVDRTCAPTVKYTCDSLNVVTVDKTHFKFTTAYTAENATFKSVTYVIKNAAGATIDTKTSTGTSLDYTQATVGKYTVEATVTFSVNGQDKTATSAACKGAFEVKETPTPPVVKYTCDSLNVVTVDKTHFKFTTAYTAENATFKSVTYVIKNAAGATVDTKTSTATSLDYTQATVGKYTVEATVTFTVDGQDKTATGAACKGAFEVKETPTPPVVKYTCDALKVVTVDRTHFKFTTTYTAENAKFEGVTYTIKDASGKVLETKTATGTTLDYTQTSAGKYTVEAAVIFSVNGETKSATSANCTAAFEVPSLPNKITVCDLETKKTVTINESDFNTDKYSKDLSKCKETPVTPVTPTELPTTGTTENIVAVVGLGAIVASITYYVASRRALNQ